MTTSKEALAKLADTDFFQLAKREPHPRIRIRLLALGQLREGKTKSEVVDMFQIVYPTLREWLLRFIEDGPDGLREKKGERT
jgi:transposase